MNSRKPDLFDWLHIRRHPDFTKAKWLGAVFGAVTILLSVLLILLLPILGSSALFHLAGALWGVGPYATDTSAEAIRNIGLVLVGLIGAPFLVWRSIVAQKQVHVAEQSQITDRINKAVEGLGAEKTRKRAVATPSSHSSKPAGGTHLVNSEILEETVPNLEVRIGAIYALERIAKDSLRDHIQIMEILCAYVRENSKAISTEPTKALTEKPIPRADIQSAITVLGRRSPDQLAQEAERRFRLDLRMTDLSGVDFRRGDFSAAMFHHCRLEAAQFHDAKLIGSQFGYALLNYAEFYHAELQGTILNNAIISETGGPLSRSINVGKIYGIVVVGADLSGISYFPRKHKNLTFGSTDTKLDPSMKFDMTTIEKRIYEIEDLENDNRFDEAKHLRDRLYNEHDFVDWAPFDSNDLAIGMKYKDFMDRLGLVGWPYREW